MLVLSMTLKSIGEEARLSFIELGNEGSKRIVFTPTFTEFSITSHLPRLQPVTEQESSSLLFLTASSSEMP